MSGHFPERRAVVAAVAEKIPAARGPDCVRVGIDGVDGAGKTMFADALAIDTIHPSLRRYVRGQQLYLAACSPRRRADVVIDNSDVERPRIVEC